MGRWGARREGAGMTRPRVSMAWPWGFTLMAPWGIVWPAGTANTPRGSCDWGMAPGIGAVGRWGAGTAGRWGAGEAGRGAGTAWGWGMGRPP